MKKADKLKKKITPIVNISLINYDHSKQDEYDRKFMSPLIEGLLQRKQLALPE